MIFRDNSSRYSSAMTKNIKKIDVKEIRDNIERGVIGQSGTDVPQTVITAGTNLCTIDEDGYVLPPCINVSFSIPSLNNISIVTKEKGDKLLKEFDSNQRESNSSIITNYDSDEEKITNVDIKTINQKGKQPS